MTDVMDDGGPPDIPTLQPTTDEYWIVDGTILNTMAYNIATLDGIEGIPPKRGANPPRPGHHGATWIPKVWDQRPLTLAMWVRGSDEYGDVPFGNSRAQFRDNMETLKALFGHTDRQLEIERRVALLDGLHVRHCLAEVVSTLDFSADGPAAASFTVDLMMSDPFWYGEDQQLVLRSNPDAVAHGVTFPIEMPVDFMGAMAGATSELNMLNDGNEPSTHYRFEISGPRSNPSILFDDQDRELSMVYDIAEGHTLVLDGRDRSVLEDGYIERYSILQPGSRWPVLYPGVDNWMKFFSDAGGGTGPLLATWSAAYK